MMNTEDKNMNHEGVEVPNYYGEDGLLYCGVCREPKEAFFPGGKELLGRRTHPSMCLCDRTEYERLEKGAKQLEHEQEVSRLRARCFTDKYMNNWTFENDNGLNPKMKNVKAYVSNWETNEKENCGLLLWGGVGTGKSYMAGCIAGTIQQENKPIEQQLAGYYDKNGEWHQQGLTPDQLKELSQRKEQLQKEEEKLRIEQYKVDELARLMKEVQEKAVETHEQLADNMRVFECQQADFEQEKANLQTQMKALVEERNAVKKMRADADGMLQKSYKVADICRSVLQQENMMEDDFLDFLDRESQRRNKPVRQTFENLYKKFDMERRAKLSPYANELDELSENREKARRARELQQMQEMLSMHDTEPREMPISPFF